MYSYYNRIFALKGLDFRCNPRLLRKPPLARPSANLHRKILCLFHGDRLTGCEQNCKIKGGADYDPSRVHSYDRFSHAVTITGYWHQLVIVPGRMQRSQRPKALVEDH